MTVRQLIEILQKVVDQDRVVVVASDPEGNSYDLLSGNMSTENCVFNKHEATVGLEYLTPELKSKKYSEEDVKQGQKAIVIGP